LNIRLEKQSKGLWGAALMQESGSLPAAGARQPGLRTRLQSMQANKAQSGRVGWPRRWRERVISLPLGYTRKLLHTTDYLDFVIWILMVGLVLICPYTKVEESFGMQAVHDILYHRWDFAAYDHHLYPGVVARTFVGPLFVALFSSPWVMLGWLLGADKVVSQLIVRIVLGTLLIMCFKLFRLEVGRKFGQTTGTALGLVCCTQFHLLFYISRMLPNVIALGLVLLALRMWMNERYTRMIFIFCLTIVVFRAEVVLLLAGVILDALLRRRVKFFWVVWCGIVFGLLNLLVSVGVDSLFWGRLIWPEGSGLLFNVVNNQSHLYGVSPWYWYFSSAIPRALLLASPLVLLGFVVQPRIRSYVIPAVVMVMLFSFLPHKELRFIFYALPLLNLAAASAIDWIWKRRSILGVLFIAGILGGSLAGSTVMMGASYYNYPGGNALRGLHQNRGNSAPPGTSVWLDNLACQTGVTRFLQERDDWLYDKRPEVERDESYSDFSFVISEKEAIGGFKEIGSSEGYAGLKLSFPPAIKHKKVLRVFENQM
jgi:alpha-1,6-mannosyltransferase